MKVRYLEHHPDEWLVGVAGLTPEQNGIYRTICDLIASSGGPIPIDDERLFRIIKAKRNRINRVISELLAVNKCTITGSKLSNNRVISELERANNRVKSGKELASKRWHSNDLDDAARNARARNQEPRTNNQEPVEKPPQRRASRLPADFKMPEDWIVEGTLIRVKAGLPGINLSVEADHFIDFWHAKGGKDGYKLDWRATWRNWCRNARSTPANAPVANGHDLSFHAGPTEPPPPLEGIKFPMDRAH